MCFKQNRRFKSKRDQHDYREKMNKKYQQSINHANVNVDLMVENVIQIKSGIMINNDVSLKNMLYL